MELAGVVEVPPHPTELPKATMSPVRQSGSEAPQGSIIMSPVISPSRQLNLGDAYTDLRERYDVLCSTHDDVVVSQVLPLQHRLSELAVVLSDERTHREGLGILLEEKDRELEILKQEMKRQKLLEYMIIRKKDDQITTLENTTNAAAGHGTGPHDLQGHGHGEGHTPTHGGVHLGHDDANMSSDVSGHRQRQSVRLESPVEAGKHPIGGPAVGPTESWEGPPRRNGTGGSVSSTGERRRRAATCSNPDTSMALSGTSVPTRRSERRKSDVSFKDMEGAYNNDPEAEQSEEGYSHDSQSEMMSNGIPPAEREALITRADEAAKDATEAKAEIEVLKQQLQDAQNVAAQAQKETGDIAQELLETKDVDDRRQDVIKDMQQQIENYIRAEDEMPAAIQEAEGQIMDLQKQLSDQKQEATCLYDDMKREFKTQFSETVSELNNQIEVLKQRVNSLKDETAEHENEKIALQKLTQQLRQAVAQASREASVADKKAQAYEQENRILKQNTAQNKRDIELLRDKAKSLEAAKNQLQDAAAQLNNEYTLLLGKYNTTETEKSGVQRKVTEMDTELSNTHGEYLSQLKSSEQEMIRLMEKLDAAEENARAMETEINALQDTLSTEKLRCEDEKRRADREELVSKRLREEAQRARSDVETLRAVLSQQSGVLDGVDSALAEKDQTVIEYEREIRTAAEKNQTLLEVEQRLRKELRRGEQEWAILEKEYREKERYLAEWARKSADWELRESELTSRIQDLEGAAGQIKASYVAAKQAAAATESRVLEEERRAVTSEGEVRILEARVASLSKELLHAQTQLHKTHLTTSLQGVQESVSVSPPRHQQRLPKPFSF